MTSMCFISASHSETSFNVKYCQENLTLKYLSNTTSIDLRRYQSFTQIASTWLAESIFRK